MTEHATIYQALAAAQADMGPALKTSANPAFRSKYADLASVMEACLPALNKHGICVIQPTVDEDGARYVKTILAHASGQALECRVPLIVQKNDMQGYGSAVTYARRYGLMGMAGIAPEDDDGNAAAKAAPKGDEATEPRRNDSAIGEACAYLAGAADIADLQSRWANIPTEVKSDARVIEAKEAAKSRLRPAKPSASAELADEIPY